jgi:sugar lactone lactonase YvrE
MAASSRPSPVGTVRAHHGEGAVWDGSDGTVVWIDILGRCVHRTAPDGTTTTVGLPDDVGFAVPQTGGGLLVGVGRAVLSVGFPEGDVEARADTPAGPVALRTNDAGCDGAGRVWFGTMDRAEEHAVGALYRLDGPGRATPVLHDLSVPNGPVWSPDGTTMYFTDTPTGRVRAYGYDSATGRLGADRVAVDTRGLDGHPDGMTVDAAGNLWVAFWGGWAVRCFSPTGELLDEIPFPVAQPSRPAWGGPDARTLYVTTSRKGLEADALADQPHAGCLFAVVPGVDGHVPPPAAPLPDVA